jgi:hypothetical protein
MILVTDLRKITCCPNCGNSDLDCWFNINTRKHSKYCAKCEEEMFEKEPDLCVVDADSESKKSRATKDKEGFVFEMREEISNLTWNIYDTNSQVLVENIQNIFNRIIDYIEEN